MAGFLYEISGAARVLALEVDVLTSVTRTVEVQPTEFPVEDGAPFSDHTIQKTSPIEVEGVINDYPLNGPPQPGRSEAGWQTLRKLALAGTRLEVVLPRERISDVVIARADSTQTVTEKNLVRFKMTLRPFVVRSTQTVPAQKRREAKTKTKTELGQQTTSPADAATSTKSKSVLFRYVVEPLLGKSK